MTKSSTKPSYCYVLRLKEGKYYIGSAFNPRNRYKEHRKGCGAEWTKQYPPLERVKEIRCETLGEAFIVEDALTLWMMVKFGKDNVRGGRWLKEGSKHIAELPAATRIVANKQHTSAQIKEELMILALKSGVQYSWYWKNLLGKYPSISQGRYFKSMLNKCDLQSELPGRHTE